MKETAKRPRAGEAVSDAVANGGKLVTDAGFALDYFEVRQAETLAPVASAKQEPIRILVAAVIGNTRLIDNLAV
jgi:pantoate--beta-alanine ligase